jgi:ABC-type branched-subunit amino acid transport system substrate-binding protein/streptogramin lyase/predicted Ser/Thr protein kinase
MRAAFTPGTTFAGYRVESLIGRGGMGVVYLARDLRLDRPVALKLIAPELADDEQFRARFLREPKLAASLDHPNVIPIYEAGEHDGQLYLAMRFVEGSDLRTLLEREGKLSPERTLAILAQVAGALDAAHRRALVHRDMKPANVLLDQDGHAYLTDFGITKQLGGASTDTGRIVGTLDYLAPEQIRGDPVDGRTDSYALACVLYECLAGKPPFRRATEAETMWAHMQDPPPPLRGHARVDAVLRKALAKDTEARYRTCGELIADAATALGLELPGAPPRPIVPEALHRRAPAMITLGGVVLAVAVGLAILAMTGGDDGGGAEPLGNGVAALDPASGSVDTFVDSPEVPGNVAVGEGAVWMLENERASVARIDPETKRVTRRFKTEGIPSELAVGEGAVWIGQAGGGDSINATVGVSRLDPDSGRVTRTVRLRGDTGVLPVAGAPRIAVGAGAVWAANPDGSISRIDPETGRLEATIETGTEAFTIAAGKEGVWFLGGDSAVARIDPRRNRVAQKIRVGSSTLFSVAIGAGSVWAAARDQGVVWRIEPREGGPATRTIDVGVGVSFVSFGEGAVWAANYADGIVSRIDPSRNRVTARTSVGAPQAIAAGAGAAWVSVAGGTTEDSLAISSCGRVISGTDTPDVLIASDLPLQGPESGLQRAVEDAMRFTLERRRFRAGEFSVGYQSCDVSTPQTGGFEFRKCAANASAYAHAEKLVAVMGPWSSYCGQVQIPILNRAPGGPLAMVSPSATHPGLTRGGPLGEAGGVGIKGEPEVYYPTGVPNFFRVVPREDLQGVASAMLAKRLGLRRVFVITQGDFHRAEHAEPFRRTTARLGLQVVGFAGFDPDAQNFDGLASRVANARPDGVYLAGAWFEGGDRVLQALRERLGARMPIMATDQFIPIRSMLEAVGPAARGLYVSATDVPPAARAMTPSAERFARDFGARMTPAPYVLPAAQAADVVMRAIARSDGTRSSVLRQLRNTSVKGGLLGDFRFDRGDITPAEVPIFRVTGRTPRDEQVFEIFDGAVVERVIDVSARLAG